MRLRLTGWLLSALILALGMIAVIPAPTAVAQNTCGTLPSRDQLQAALVNAASGTGISGALGPGTNAGGIFGGARMWGAIVDRRGEVCFAVTSTPDPTQVWPISQAIAKAKAYTANSVSLDDFDLSTARMYTLVQPGHSLFGVNQSNPFNPSMLAAPGGSDPAANQVAGGIITFGGGVPLYSNGHIVGALGISGDTACADHEIAKRTRDLLGLNPADGPLADDIVYAEVDGPSVFAHPLCPNTLRNGISLGDEQP